MLKVLLIFVCGFSAALGIGNFGIYLFGLDDLKTKVSSRDDPKPCCLPETWQGFVQSVFGMAEGRGRSTGSMVTTQIFVDGQKKRLAGKIMTGCPKIDSTFVGFYNETSGKGFRLYSYKTTNATKCWSHYWDKFEYQKPCLPQNSTFQGELNLGLKSAAFAVNSFGFSDTRGKFEFRADMLVTKDACVPVAFREIGAFGGRRPHEEVELYGDADEVEGRPGKRLLFSPKSESRRDGRKKFVVGALYNDLEAKISDEKVFDLPDICKKNPEKYPLNLDEISDPATREGFENLEALLEHIII